MSTPHDYYLDEYGEPILHSRGNSRKYVEQDLVSDFVKDQLPSLSTIGRGPQGAGIYPRIVSNTKDEFIFQFVNDETDEVVMTSDNLSAGDISISVPKHTPVSGERVTATISVKKGSQIYEYPITIPAGAVGSRWFIGEGIKEKHTSNVYYFKLNELLYDGLNAYRDKPIPRPNDLVGFIDDKFELVLGNVDACENDTVVVVARNCLHVPMPSINEDGIWEVGGVSTGKPSKGDPGIDGKNAIIKVGNVEDVSYGQPSVSITVDEETNTYTLNFGIPEGAAGKAIDIQGGIWTTKDLPDYDSTAVNTAFIVYDGDKQFDLYIRGRIPVIASEGGPWTVVEDWQGRPGSGIHMLNKPYFMSSEVGGIETVPAAEGSLAFSPSDYIADGDLVIDTDMRIGIIGSSEDNSGFYEIETKGVITSTWDNIVGKPDTYPTTWDEVDDKPETFPTTWSQVDGKPDTFPADWNNIKNKPTSFGVNNWSQLQNKPFSTINSDWLDTTGSALNVKTKLTEEPNIDNSTSLWTPSTDIYGTSISQIGTQLASRTSSSQDQANMPMALTQIVNSLTNLNSTSGYKTVLFGGTPPDNDRPWILSLYNLIVTFTFPAIVCIQEYKPNNIGSDYIWSLYIVNCDKTSPSNKYVLKENFVQNTKFYNTSYSRIYGDSTKVYQLETYEDYIKTLPAEPLNAVLTTDIIDRGEASEPGHVYDKGGKLVVDLPEASSSEIDTSNLLTKNMIGINALDFDSQIYLNDQNKLQARIPSALTPVDWSEQGSFNSNVMNVMATGAELLLLTNFTLPSDVPKTTNALIRSSVSSVAHQILLPSGNAATYNNIPKNGLYAFWYDYNGSPYKYKYILINPINV